MRKALYVGEGQAHFLESEHTPIPRNTLLKKALERFGLTDQKHLFVPSNHPQHHFWMSHTP